jgi:hypothetical protein
MAELPTGTWQDRVAFAPDGGFAYRPGDLLVHRELTDLAEEELRRSLRTEGKEPDLRREPLDDAFERITGPIEVLDALMALTAAGIPAQPNHVLFATCCCPPHPSSPEAASFYANPFYAKAVAAAPFYAKPFYAKAGSGGCCCCWDGHGAQANPFYAKSVLANPFYAKADHVTGRRRSSARPCPAPQSEGAGSAGDEPVRIAILDTGWAESHQPSGLPGIDVTHQGGDKPDADGDGFLDPAAGHGTFIAGIIEQLAPGCALELISVLTTYGDGDEETIAKALHSLATRPEDERPHLVNLSFGGYTPIGMATLAHAITELRRRDTIVVASAGNDGTCEPLYPAAFPDVISVGAIDADGHPAPFSNYGPGLRACSDGVDVVSLFFEGFDGAEPPTPKGEDEDRFDGWATWSGTSFSAPRVVAALARLLQGGTAPVDAVTQLIDDEQLERRPMLGAVVAAPGS